MTDTEPDPNLDDWLLYKKTADLGARERLIVNYLPLVKYVAGRVGAGLPQSVEHADLVSYGVFGLIDAIEKFDLGRGFKFETYAISRIKGAILDELRSIDWVPRSVRGKQRSVETATRKLEAELHRLPIEGELAVELELSVDQLRDVRTQIGNVYVSGFDDIAIPGDDHSVEDSLPDGAPNIVDGLTVEQDIDLMRRTIAAGTERLTDRERIVLTLYYHDGLTLAEIGDVLGVTESRVCQIHTKAVLQLRALLSASELEPA